ncbi:hypothetical protein H0H93_016162 [Arthromyces matolae]|nr:hypothetical protein H0H93_016162 [Arthromyces matolae]
MPVEKVSFTIRRPTPLSRAPSSGIDSDWPSNKPSPLVRSSTSSPAPSSRINSFVPHEQDSSDDDDDKNDELVTHFDRFGVRRANKRGAEKDLPLVIPPLQNRDWRDMARKRKTLTQYVPASAKAMTGEDGSVGGLGTRDTINSGPVLVGLQQLKKASTPVKQEDETATILPEADIKMEPGAEDDDEDKAALRAILAGVDGPQQDGPIIDVIPSLVSEADAYKQDVQELPDSATLDDYARVPVSQFGAALLRGMGWKEGTAATRKPGKGLVEPYLPEARPALLGIGAKEQEVLDDGSKKKGRSARPDKKYVPLLKKERLDRPSSAPQLLERRGGRSRSPPRNASTAVSRRNSRSRERASEQDEQRTRSSDRRERDYRRDGRDRDRKRDDHDYDRSDRRPRHDIDRDRRRDRSADSYRRRRA